MNNYHKNQTLLIVCFGLIAALAISAAGERIDETQELIGEGEFHGGHEQGLSETPQQGLNNVFGQVTGRLANLIGVQHEAPLSPKNLEGRSAAITSSDLLAGASLEPPAPSAVARGVARAEEKKVDLFSQKGIGEWARLLFNPIELVKAIGVHFKLDVNKFIDKLGRGAVFGVEAILSPLIATTKIVEKVFVPDACRLKFMCRMGTYLVSIRDSVLKLSPNFLESSTQIKALSDGIVGRDCELAFPSCEPRLKRTYEDLKSTQEGGYVSGARSGPAEGLLAKAAVKTV